MESNPQTLFRSLFLHIAIYLHASSRSWLKSDSTRHTRNVLILGLLTINQIITYFLTYDTTIGRITFSIQVLQTITNTLSKPAPFCFEFNHLKWSEQAGLYTQTECTLTNTHTQFDATRRECTDGSSNQRSGERGTPLQPLSLFILPPL